jgi:hypothetical protein
MEHVMSHAPGYDKLAKWTPIPIMPTPAGEGRMFRTLAEMRNINVIGVGLGGATTNVYSVYDGKFVRTVSANLGMSYSIRNVLKEAGTANIRRWLPFEIHDVKEHKKISFDAPDEIYDMLLFMGRPAAMAVKAVYHRESNEIAAVSSTDKLSMMAGRYVGKDDPVCIVRSQGEFPAVGEVLEPFANPILVEGWMRGSHHGPLMPVSVEDSTPSRFDGPPRVIANNFMKEKAGKLLKKRMDNPIALCG